MGRFKVTQRKHMSPESCVVFRYWVRRVKKTSLASGGGNHCSLIIVGHGPQQQLQVDL